jgi:hypothetical protein
MGTGDVRRTGENRTWTAQPAEQTDQSPHRDRRESRPDGESASNGKFVNTLLDEKTTGIFQDARVRQAFAIAWNFWDSWIDERNHLFPGFYEGIAKEQWPALAR